MMVKNKIYCVFKRRNRKECFNYILDLLRNEVKFCLKKLTTNGNKINDMNLS